MHPETFRRLAGHTAGASLPEYGLIVGTILLAGFAAFKLLGGNDKQEAQCGADLLSGGGAHCAPAAGSSQPIALNAPPSNPASGGSGPAGGSGGFCTRTGCSDGTHCFVAGTQVLTREGEQPIETLRPGDPVLSADEDTGVLLYRPVTAIFETPDQPLVLVRVAGERDAIRATPGHPFYTLDRGWVEAASLVPGEPLGESTGTSSAQPTLPGVGAVESVAVTADRAPVFNIEVEGTHTYFVGGAHVLVHNTKCTPFWQNNGGNPNDIPQPPPPAKVVTYPQRPQSGSSLLTQPFVGKHMNPNGGAAEAVQRFNSDPRVSKSTNINPKQKSKLTQELADNAADGVYADAFHQASAACGGQNVGTVEFMTNQSYNTQTYTKQGNAPPYTASKPQNDSSPIYYAVQYDPTTQSYSVNHYAGNATVDPSTGQWAPAHAGDPNWQQGKTKSGTQFSFRCQ